MYIMMCKHHQKFPVDRQIWPEKFSIQGK